MKVLKEKNLKEANFIFVDFDKAMESIVSRKLSKCVIMFTGKSFQSTYRTLNKVDWRKGGDFAHFHVTSFVTFTIKADDIFSIKMNSDGGNYVFTTKTNDKITMIIG